MTGSLLMFGFSILLLWAALVCIIEMCLVLVRHTIRGNTLRSEWIRLANLFGLFLFGYTMWVVVVLADMLAGGGVIGW